MPDVEEINEILNQLERKSGEIVFINDLQPILVKLNKPQYLANFEKGNSASQLAIEVFNRFIFLEIFYINFV